MDFGSSGSGVVRQWEPYGTVQQIDGSFSPVYKYSFAGPLTMSKGCDQAVELRTRDPKARKYIYRGSNPAVVTDATCYMDWIAEQYQLRRPALRAPGTKRISIKTCVGPQTCSAVTGTSLIKMAALITPVACLLTRELQEMFFNALTPRCHQCWSVSVR